MITTKKRIFIALFYLVVAAVLGIVLRLFPITNINATYKYIVHTHSHIALLGWVYIALTTVLYHVGIHTNQIKKYRLIFWSTQFTIIGMLLSFPFIGYALYSIIFSTLFLFCSYWFYFFFKKNHTLNPTSISCKFIATSLLFMVISSIGPWLLGIIMNTVGTTSHWYKNAIYFYLHFQYNGWFIFCLIGLFYFILEKKQIQFSLKRAQLFYQLMLISCLLTLFLSFLWIKPPMIVYGIAGIGAVLQVFAFTVFYQQLKAIRVAIKNSFNLNIYLLLQLVLVFFFLKVILQSATSIPYFAALTATIVDFVVGYLHLIFLGIVTVSTFVILNYFELIQLPKFWARMYLIGFITSEILIFYKGFSTWQQFYLPENYFIYLVICSALMPIGILGIFYKNATTIFPTQVKSV